MEGKRREMIGISFLERVGKWFPGSTGDPPVPSGDPPDGTETTIRGNENGLFATWLSAVPVGGRVARATHFQNTPLDAARFNERSTDSGRGKGGFTRLA